MSNHVKKLRTRGQSAWLNTLDRNIRIRTHFNYQRLNVEHSTRNKISRDINNNNLEIDFL